MKNTSFAPGNVSIKWYEDGTLNLAANCLDRHLQENGDRTAIIWEGDDASQSKHISYKELHRYVCRFANTLLELGIKKGDVVAICCAIWCRKPRLRCWPAPALARCIR
ncbi:AMP-binding protein [Escherichia coli]